MALLDSKAPLFDHCYDMGIDPCPGLILLFSLPFMVLDFIRLDLVDPVSVPASCMRGPTVSRTGYSPLLHSTSLSS